MKKVTKTILIQSIGGIICSIITALIIGAFSLFVIAKINESKIDNLQQEISLTSSKLDIVTKNQVCIENIQQNMAQLTSKVDMVIENQVCIKHIEKNMDSLTLKIEKLDNKLEATNLFIQSAHPDRNGLLMSFAKKVQGLTIDEMYILVNSKNKYQNASAFSQGMLKDSNIKGTLVNCNIGQADLENYWQATKGHELKGDYRFRYEEPNNQ